MRTLPFRIDDETKRLAMQAAGQASQGVGHARPAAYSKSGRNR